MRVGGDRESWTDPVQVTRRHFEILAPLDNQDLTLKPSDGNLS